MLECVSSLRRPEQKQGSDAQKGIFPRKGPGVRKLWTSDWPMPRTSGTLTSLIQVCVWDPICGSQGKMDCKPISWALELHYFPSSHNYYCFLIFFCWQIENVKYRKRKSYRETQHGWKEWRWTRMKDSLWLFIYLACLLQCGCLFLLVDLSCACSQVQAQRSDHVWLER